MSVDILDYLPFDYKRYIHEILPIWRQALTGNTRPLKDLVRSASHFSLWPCIHCPTIVPKADFTYMLDRHFYGVGWNELYLSQEHSRENIAPWDTLWPIISAMDEAHALSPTPNLSDYTLKSLLPSFIERPFGNRYNLPELLHSCLFYTFCCDLPPQDEAESKMMMTGLWGSIIIVNEGVPIWNDYIERDEETRALWAPFFQPAPPDLAAQMLSPQAYNEHASTYIPRSFYAQLEEPRPSGFLTAQETQRLVSQVRRHEAPQIDTMMDSCIHDATSWGLHIDASRFKQNAGGDTTSYKLTRQSYDQLHLYEDEDSEHDPYQLTQNERILYEELVKAHPEAMHTFALEYYNDLWRIEDEILDRANFAASRGWGMIVIDS
jgi:hypothetical protein